MGIYTTATIWFAIFSLFHSVTAHEVFKAQVAKVFGDFFVEHYWRLIYCIISYILLYYCFVPDLLQYETYQMIFNYPEWLWNIMAIVKLSGLVIAYWAYVQFDYFEFWGFRQAIKGLRHWRSGEPWKPMRLAGVQRLEVRGIYHFCRHPMLIGGWLFLLGTIPVVTAFVYVVLYTVYMFIGAYYEEKRLISHFGDQYEQYRKDVGAFFPNLQQVKNFFRLGKESEKATF